ncbi:adhesion G-protein coupled receptor G2-like isoform X2 [Micropterus dolomieu]|uniref:adhesion G-protein coupled receptor G2-like isoform X2 n=1 Tax=Micropterus dolomieu TaxID=147949 RepID=UPI001E8CC89B|nr:adhesion G-protein coupled receptor G2-like isoform X2 [Micropterus dolomieu]
MSPLDGKHRSMFAVEMAILFFGIFLKNSICESSDTNQMSRQKHFLFVSCKTPDSTFYFPSEVVYRDDNGIKLCFYVHGNDRHADCCNTGDFNCSFNISGNDYSLALTNETLSKQDIVLMTSGEQRFNCMPSQFYSKTSGFLLNIHKCLDTGKVKNIRLSQNSICVATCDTEACRGLAETDLTVAAHEMRTSCEPPEKGSTLQPPVNKTNSTVNSLENAVNIMKNLSSYLEQTGNSTAYIKIGNIKGVVTKLPPRNQANINIGITTSDDVKIIEENNDLITGYSRLVQIPKEVVVMAEERNGSFVGVVFFPGIHQNDSNSYFLNNEAVGIDMGTEISNLSHTIDIQFNNVDKKGNIASCRSWDGKGKEAIWITDGCRTYETNGSITCQCSHLTFFAILLSPSPGNISSSDLNSLTYITSIGCGLSMFFLAVALFMHCLIRKGKASQATKILINLFVAMFTLNLSFLTNESIANLGNFGACVTIAAVMHYTLLATFTWFFMEALHLFFNLWKHPSEIKHYMMKICVAGWVTPAVVVIALLASGKYDYLVINTSDGNAAKMCWISDAVVHQVVNIGYYAIVFIFTFSIFIITVRQIVLFKPTTGKGQDISSIKRNSYSIIGLFFLLGITWAFAFFSYGPLRVASYYIFTILNSFQGFFLFIYYYHSSKTVGEDRRLTVSGSSTTTSKTVVTNPYQLSYQ